MNSQPAGFSLLTAWILLAAIPFHSAGQSKGLSSALVLRSQAGSVAEETASRLGISSSEVGRLGVRVEGGTVRALVENALLESLNRRGFQVTLAAAQDPAGNLLQIVILDQSVLFSGLPGGDYRREVQTAIEARRASHDSSKTEYLGLFKRDDIDTVAFRDDWGFVRDPRETERTLFDRILGPVLLISGTFLVVYLFFTVRN